MKPEKQQEIALMRYGAIAPLIAGLDENYPSKTAFYTEISNKVFGSSRWQKRYVRQKRQANGRGARKRPLLPLHFVLLLS